MSQTEQNPNRGVFHEEPALASNPPATVASGGEMRAGDGNSVAPSKRSRWLRWSIAGAVVLCVVVATAAGAFVLSGAGGVKSLTASIAPKDSIGFLEVRTDLPGDQHARLADFLRHFPGFLDRAQFENGLDEALNMLTSEVSPDLRYTSAFKPWMEGEVSVAVTDLRAATSANATLGLPGAVTIFALKDRDAAERWVASEVSRSGVEASPQSYAGTTLHITGSGSGTGAYALTDHDLLVGSVEGVKAALDTKTNGSLADNANYQAAMKSLSGDSLARFYLDPWPTVTYEIDSWNAMAQSVFGTNASLAAVLGLSAKDMPAWIAGSVRAESEQMVVNLVVPHQTGSGADKHASRLAAALPGSTLGVFEVHSVGKLIAGGLAGLGARLSGGSAASLKGVADALARIGGTDWLGDGAVVLTRTGSDYGVGLVVEAPDASTASSKVALMAAFATFGGGSLGLTSRSETYKGIGVTIIGIPGGTGTAPVEIAVAARGNLIVASYTDRLVKAIIDTDAASSLASQSGYSVVMAAAGTSSEESCYIDIPVLEDEIGRAVFSASPSKWTLDYKPYFDHLGGAGCSVVGGNTVNLRLVVMAN